MATVAIVIGVNIPDIDILVSFAGENAGLAHRRGWTHGVLAWAVLPLLVTLGLLHLGRLRPGRASSTFHFWPIFMVSLLAVLSHPYLDRLSNYGIRLLMPFDHRGTMVTPCLLLIHGCG